MADPRITGSVPISIQTLRALFEAAKTQVLRQIESDSDLQQFIDQDAFNPMAMMRRFRELSQFRETRQEKAEQKKVEETKIHEVEKSDEAATRYQRNNYELQAKTLQILRSRITAKDTPQDILDKVLETYPDPALADEALDFLIETAPDPQTLAALRAAKELLNKQFGRAVKAGRNMGAEAREFSKEGLGSATSLRDMYRDITQNPREPLKLFDELSDKFSFDKMRTVIHFILHSLGADLRSKGPSIERAELKRLIDDARSLQGVLGVYRFFKGRMPLLQSQFASYHLTPPPRLDYEALSKQFIKFLAERFMSPEKILQAARLLGISEEEMAQIIVFTQMRDAVKQISPRFYRNLQHRDELLAAILKALEELEDSLEEEEEDDKDKKKKKK